MVSPELLRRYSFFGGLSHDQLVTLARVASEKTVATGHTFFREGDELKEFYLVLEGAVGIHIAVTDQDVEQSVAGQLTGEMITKDVTVSTAGTGDIFGWSALIPPVNATAGASALTSCRTVAFNCDEILRSFERDPHFAYALTRNAAQVIRRRLRDVHIESLVFKSEQSVMETSGA
jgi:CRP-like cAMP-binding protein